ncbi:MAG: tRNA (adenosine(37)-N6)-threonylcarbamoyltransferase complex transferase subunit TsaD [Candidatus Kapabacteria bacterium]|nr:tRNA (adenosine(37)-N6)-threonylcarbamoyltransferase complex transferase subunit TsaD [Candidatus Kapabacteria bacterium]
MKILAIETSCDETSAAIISDGIVASNIISSQYIHNKYGGVVPEIASRSHLKAIAIVVQDALKLAKADIKDIDAIAVTTEPGLIGSLVVGSNFAKGLSIRHNLPVVPINHIEGHLFSGFINNSSLKFPFIALVVSGGHTILFEVNSFNSYEIIGQTIDDAAGEAFDKTAKLIGLDYPGGPLIDKYAKMGNPEKYKFPRPLINSNDFNFSFSGLKTSVRYFINKNFPNGVEENNFPDLCASVQEAIVDVLISKSINALKQKNLNQLVVAGGVSANSRLRGRLADISENQNIEVFIPEFQYCMDNAGMIGFIASKKIEEKGLSYYKNLTFTASPNVFKRKGMEKE